MVEQAGEDYAKILRSADLAREINPLCTNIEDMLARLDEFETLLSNVRAETNSILGNNVCGILSFANNFEQLRQRIDSLEQFVAMANENLTQVERSVDIAEEELHVNDYSFKNLVLKPLLAKAKGSTSPDSGGASDVPRTNLINNEYQAVPVFKTSDYFVDITEMPSLAPPPPPPSPPPTTIL